MNDYTYIDYEEDYNPKELTAKVSCRNMSILSQDEMVRNNVIFASKFDTENCQKHYDLNKNIEKIKNNESDLLKGVHIDKKSCLFKRPHYGLGDWQDQFNHNTNIHQLFNYQSKAKTNDIPKCHYEMPNNFDVCDKEPYFTYTKTFTNDYYNCVI